MDYTFKRAIVGGTFDRFHTGHQSLLRKAFEESAYVIIGVATDALFQQKTYAHLIEDFATRRQTVADFIKANDFTERSEIVPIHDFYGTSLTDRNLEAIFITESNRANVKKINEEREKRTFPSLTTVIVPYILGNDNKIVSSARIRSGEIDRNGEAYGLLFAAQEQFSLPEKEREAFRNPLGEVFTDNNEMLAFCEGKSMVIAVGDIVASTLLQNGRQADISIIDGKTRREVVIDSLRNAFSSTKTIQTTNPAGTVTKKAASCLEKSLAHFYKTNEKQLIFVSGEEDLLSIPAILFAPLNSVVFYGQFDKGAVAVHVSEQIKKNVYHLFRKLQ